MRDALAPLLLAALGLPVVVGGVWLFARRQVEQHADRYAEAVRAAFAAQRDADRVKEPIR